MQFEHPHYLWSLLVAVPALVAFFWWAAREKQRVLEKFISARLLPGLLAGVSAGRRKARMILVIASVVLLIVTLARPQIGFSWEEARSRGLDIVVAIDTSRSMLAADVAPNRLRRAQLSALDLKRLARADRLALVAFAGGAFLQCPLTLDDMVFRQSVEALDVNIIPQGGTALGEAIDAAKGAFKEGNDNHKVLVLFTDGEDHDGNAVAGAKAAAKDGMRIFTVGVGTANGELLRTLDVSGRSEFIKDSDGNAVKSRLNEALLREVAQETGGFYLPLSGANTMNLLYERGLAPLPKSDLASQRIKRHHERYQWLLGLAIVLLLIEMLLPDRKTSKAAASAGNAASATVAKAAVILAMLAAPALVFAGPGGALKRYQGGEYGRALEEYERSLKSKPDDPRLHFNAGAAAFQNKDYDQALNHLSSALVTEDVGLQQRAYYNIGNTKFRQGESASEPEKKQQLWEQAIKSFDSALTLDPKDTDSEFNKEFVKKRLEELKQQQQQQNKDDKNNKDDKKDQKDQSKQDQQSKDQQSKDQQKQDQKNQQQNQDKDKQGQDQQKKDEEQRKQDEASKQKQEQDGEKKPDQTQQQQQGEQQEGNEGQQARAARMTPQQAAQLLEAVKGEEKLMTFKPVLKSNRTDRVFKDW
jgi:Ca-activated chloride channel family protein